MLSHKTKTEGWHYVTYHFTAMWKVKSYIQAKEQQLDDVGKFYKNANWAEFQKRYTKQMEETLVEIQKSYQQIIQIDSSSVLKVRVAAIVRPVDGELLTEEDVFYEDSGFGIVYVRQKNKQREIKLIYYKFQEIQDLKDKYMYIEKDVHKMINFLIRNQVLVPGGTPKSAYKWGAFNINCIGGCLSSSLESVVKANGQVLIQEIDYLQIWKQKYGQVMDQ